MLTFRRMQQVWRHSCGLGGDTFKTSVCQAYRQGRQQDGVAQQAMCKGFGITVQFCQGGDLTSGFPGGFVEATKHCVILVGPHLAGVQLFLPLGQTQRCSEALCFMTS